MKSSLIKKTSKSIVLGLAILSLGACGKNMHIPVGNEPAVKTADPNAKKDAGAGGGGADGVAVPVKGFTSDKLTALSKWDVANLLKGNTKGVRLLGDSSDVSEDGNIKINRDSILEARAVILVPADKDIKSISKFTLTLKGLNVVVAKAGEKAKKEDAAKEQVCIGKAESTCLDISALADKAIGKLEDGSVINQAEKEITLDLIKDFGIAKEGASADEVKVSVLKWLADNSLDFSKTGFRKIQIRLMNNSNISEGSLNLQPELVDAKAVSLAGVPSAADLANGEDDVAVADALSKSKEVKVSKISEESAEDADQKTAEEKKIADDEAAKKIEEAKKAAEDLKKAQEEQVAAEKKAAEEAAKKLADEAAKKAAEQPATNVDANQNAAAATQTQATTETAASGQQAAATTEVKN